MRIRKLVHLTLVMAFAGFGSHSAQAQSTAPWPSKPIRLIVPVAPGSAPDLIARMLADKLQKSLGQPVVVDNKPGAGGIIGMNLLKAAPADGYTFAIAHASAVAVTPLTYKQASYDPVRDFETVAMVGRSPMLIVTQANSPLKTLGEAIEQAKAKAGQIALGNPTRTSIPHLAGEMLAARAGAKFEQVPFSNSAQGVRAAVSGDVALYVDGVPPLTPLVKAGRLRVLAVTADVALPGLEDYPLANKTVPGLNAYGWAALMAPKGTPPEIVHRLNHDASLAQQQPDFIARLRDLGTYAMAGSASEAARYVAGERDQLGSLIKTLDLKPE